MVAFGHVVYRTGRVPVVPVWWKGQPECVVRSFGKVVEADKHIDVVYAYHNRSSAQVQEAYHEALVSGGRKGLVRNNPENRLVDADADLLEISVRSLRRHMAGIRDIYVVVDYDDEISDAVRSALDLRVVLTSDIVPVQHATVFSGLVKEAFTHRIPTLSERYLSLNDDMLVVAPTSTDYFFPSPTEVRVLTGIEHKIESLVHVAFRLFAGPQGVSGQRRYTSKQICNGCQACETRLTSTSWYPSHAPRAMLRSYMMRMEQQYPSLFESVSSTRFRCFDCLNPHVMMIALGTGDHRWYVNGTRVRAERLSAKKQNVYVADLETSNAHTIKDNITFITVQSATPESLQLSGLLSGNFSPPPATKSSTS